MNRPRISFRDPEGVCCQVGARVLRFVERGKVAQLESFIASPTASGFVAGNRLASTRRLSAAELEQLRGTSGLEPFFVNHWPDAVFEHERIWFPSYPYEWPAEMLWEAGRLTLELARRALQDGYILKDATPYNVLFRGACAVFVDLLSFESHVPGDPVWRAYAQLVRTFVLPLMAQQQWGLSLAETFLSRRDGLEPSDLYRHCGWMQRFKPSFFSLVSIPTWLTPLAEKSGRRLYEPRCVDAQKATFIIESQLKRLETIMNRLQGPSRPRPSGWSSYMATNSYSQESFAAKELFVQNVLSEFKPARVLDVGANTGHFSRLAAKAGAQVVAIDSDPVCVGEIWRASVAQQTDILSLVVDLARPSPCLGWRNRENPSFLDRATGAFDCVFMLGLIHHLLVTERVPLEEILDLAAELTTSLLVIEFVAPADEMFKQLTRGRDRLYASLTQARFERAFEDRFEALRATDLPGTRRRIYTLRKKGSAH